MFIVAHNGAHVFGGAERGVASLLAGLRDRGHRVLMIGTFKKLWLATLAGRMARVPRMIARIGLESDLPRNLKYRLIIPWLDAVVLKADDVRPRWREALRGLEPARLVTIHGAVTPPPRTGPAGRVRAELGLSETTPLIGAVARLARQKRFDRLVRALAVLPRDVHCVLAGEGKLRGEIEAQAVQLGVRDRLHMLGHRDDVRDVLDALDLFVVCSDKEMLCFAMLESLASGVPVVSTPVSGAHEALDPLPDGRSPGVVVGWDEAELAVAIRGLLADPARRAAMRDEALRRAKERFGFERMLDRWEAVLEGRPAPAEG